MKPNMLKKWSVALLVAAGAAGLVGCNNVRVDEGTNAAALTDAEAPTDTENFGTGLNARSLSLVQADVDQSMGDMISPTSGALHVLDSHYDTVKQNWTTHQNGGSASLLANEADRLNLVYNAIRDRFDGIYDNTGAAEVRTDVATVTINNVVKGKTYSVNVTSNVAFSQSNASSTTGTVVANADGMDDVEAAVSITSTDNLRYTLNFAAVASGSANIDLKNVAGGYTVTVSEDGGTSVSLSGGSLKDDFAPLVALQHADRNGQDKTNYNNTSAPHDSLGMLIEYGEQSTDEAGEPLNGFSQEFYPKLNLTASLYDECHKRSKSENLDVNVAGGQEPINASELDVNYYTTPLLATNRSATINAITYANGKCATEQQVGTTCATNRSDRFYNENDFTCWEGVSSANSCKYYVPEPGAASGFVEVEPLATNQSGYKITTVGAGAGTEIVPNTAAASLLTLATVQAALGYTIPSTQSDAAKSTLSGTGISFVSPVDATITYTSSIVFKGPANCEGTTTELARAVVVDLTDDTSAITGGSTKSTVASGYSGTNIVNHDGTTTTGNSMLESLGLWHLETPAQFYAANHNYRFYKNYDEDKDNSYTDDWQLSTRTHHLVATFGDWRTIDENRRFINSSQDVIRGDAATLYGPRMGYVVNNNVYGPVSGNAAVTNFHYGLRAEDYVVDSESDGAVKDTLMKLTGVTDATNNALAIGTGDATGVVFVDATPAMNQTTNTSGASHPGSAYISAGAADTQNISQNRNNDGSIVLTFDQNLLDVDSYPANSYLDLFGDDFVYRVDLGANDTAIDNDATVVRGNPFGGDTGYLNGVAGTLDVSESSTVDANNNANSKRLVGASTIDFNFPANTLGLNGILYEGSKVRLTEVDPGFATSDNIAGSNTISISGLENGIIAEGSIIQIGNGERAHRYRVVDNTDGDGYVTVASNVAEFVITPALRGAVASGRDVTIEKSSTHIITDNDIAAAVANQLEEVAIYPSLPSNYGSNTVVTVLNGIVDDGATTAYTDIFGLSTGELSAANVAATVVASGKTMTISVSDVVDANNLTDDNVDMGAFFSDLSHTSADSVAGTAATPSFFINYEDVQDTNFNSWAKTDEYDNYDDGRSPLIVAKDVIVPKILRGATNLAPSSNTFLYDVTSEIETNLGIKLVGAHGNHGLTTDDDIIYTPGISGTTYTAAAPAEKTYTAALAAGAGNYEEFDYPLFYFWGHQTADNAGTATTLTQDQDGGAPAQVRAVLKLSGVTTIDTSTSQAYIYAPGAVDSDQNDAVGDVNQFTGQCTLDEGEIDNFIFPTALVSGITQSLSVNAANSAAGYGADDPETDGSAVAVNTSNVYFQLEEQGDVFNVDANVNGNRLSGTSPADKDTSALIVGIPAYGGNTWQTFGRAVNDTLVIEDVTLDGVVYTLHFKIPQYVGSDTNTAGATLLTQENHKMPTMVAYRKVSISGMDLTPSGEVDVCSSRNVRAGNLVTDDYDPDQFIVGFREDIKTASLTYLDGDDNDQNAVVPDTNGYDSLFATANLDAHTVAGNPSQVRIRMHDITEATSKYVGHDAQVNLTTTDFAGNTGAFTMTFRLGHGFLDNTGGGRITSDGAGATVGRFDAGTTEGAVAGLDEDGTAAGITAVRDPILNVIGVLEDIHNISDATDTTGGSDDSVE